MSNLSSQVRGSTDCKRNEDALLYGHFHSFWVDRPRGSAGASTKHRHDGGSGGMNGVWNQMSATCRQSACCERPPNTLESVKIKSMGETTTLTVHRCRFIDFNPSSITALAFPPLPLPSTKSKRKASTTDRVPKFGPLIVGHANGNIEIYEWTGSTDIVEAPQAWVVRKVRVQSLFFFFFFCGVALMLFFCRHSRD